MCVVRSTSSVDAPGTTTSPHSSQPGRSSESIITSKSPSGNCRRSPVGQTEAPCPLVVRGSVGDEIWSVDKEMPGGAAVRRARDCSDRLAVADHMEVGVVEVDQPVDMTSAADERVPDGPSRRAPSSRAPSRSALHASSFDLYLGANTVQGAPVPGPMMLRQIGKRSFIRVVASVRFAPRPDGCGSPIARHDPRTRYRCPEASAGDHVFALLIGDLPCEVPGEQQNIIGAIFEEPLHRFDRDAASRHELALLVRVSVDHVGNRPTIDARGVEECRSLGGGSIRRDSASISGQRSKQVPEHCLARMRPLRERLVDGRSSDPVADLVRQRVGAALRARGCLPTCQRRVPPCKSGKNSTSFR